MRYCIYALRDSRLGRDRYIGSTAQDPHKRLTGHVAEAKMYHFKQNPKILWIRRLMEQGRKPFIAIIDEADNGSDATALEGWWVDYKRQQGERLFNGLVAVRDYSRKHD